MAGKAQKLTKTIESRTDNLLEVRAQGVASSLIAFLMYEEDPITDPTVPAGDSRILSAHYLGMAERGSDHQLESRYTCSSSQSPSPADMWKFFSPDVEPTIGTSLPVSPVDGQEFTLVDSLTAPTYSWRLRYVSAKASNKWVFIGGSPGFSEVTASESTASTSYTALTTAGPLFAIPLAGDYHVEIGCHSLNNLAGQQTMSYDIGGTGAVDADSIEEGQDASSRYGNHTRTMKKTGLTTVTLTAKYKTGAGTGTFKNRFMRVFPIAIGG